MKTVFFYGLFMDRDLLIEKGLNPQNIKIAYLQGYQLKIGEKATLAQNGQACSYGTIMDLDSNALIKLYASDGVQDYFPMTVQASTMDGASVEAISYILPINKLSGKNSEYATRLAGIARKLGLPENYIHEIKTWI